MSSDGIWLAAGLLLVVALCLFVILQNLALRRRLDRFPTALPDLQRPLMDLTERMTRVSGEMRESIVERLGRHSLEAQERLDRTLAQGRQELHAGLMKTTEALEAKFRGLEGQVGTRLESIGQSVETKLNENLKEGFKHFEKVQLHLQSAELKLAALNVVGQGITDLNNLLKLPHLRGGFGEATLERLLADFLPITSYEVQYQIVPNSPERVDAIVRFAKQMLPIDSKFPRDQLLPLFDDGAHDPAIIEAARRSLSEFVRVQAKSIADKYIRPDHGTTEMALLFLPSETLYFEVVRDGKLFEYLTKLKVFPVSPNTLCISLNSVAMAQEYYDMARGVEKTIEDVKKARRHFEHFERRFDEVGRGLRKAQEAFETASTHLGHYENSVYRLVGEMPAPDEGEVLPGAGRGGGGGELPAPGMKGGGPEIGPG